MGTAVAYHTAKEEFQAERSTALQIAREEIELEDTNRGVATRADVGERAPVRVDVSTVS